MADRMVRAKFVVQEERRTSNQYREFKLTPVYSNKDDTENKAFWDATPSGTIVLGITNKEAWPHFELGKAYYVDFTLAPDE